MRGTYTDHVTLDEFSYYRQNIFAQVIPTLTDISRQGYNAIGLENQSLDAIYTPKGRNHPYQFHKDAEAWHRGRTVKSIDPFTGEEFEEERDDWYAVLYRASQTGYVSREQLVAARRIMGEDLFLQEFECSFDAVVKGAIFTRAINSIRDAGRITTIPHNPMRSVNTAWDLGINDSTVIWFFQTSEENNNIKIIDYYENSNQALDYYVDIMAEKPYRYGYHLLPHDVNNRELGSGKSRYDILKTLGLQNISVVPRVQVKADSIHAANAFLARCWFDAEKCEVGLDNLSLYRREFNEKLNVPQDNPIKDASSHAADGFMCLAMGIKAFRETRQDDFLDNEEMYL